MISSLPEFADSLRRLANGIDAGATTAPLRQNAAEARSYALWKIGTAAHVDGVAFAWAEPGGKLQPSPTHAQSAEDRALVSFLMQACRELASVTEGKTEAGASERLRLIATGIAPQAEGPAEGGKLEVGASSASIATGPAVALPSLLMNVAEVGASCGGISERQVRAWVSSGKFPPPVNLDSKLSRWRRADVEAWVKGMAPRK